MSDQRPMLRRDTPAPARGRASDLGIVEGVSARPVQHEGRGLPGTLMAARRDREGRGGAWFNYTDPTVALSWYHWRPAHELRPRSEAEAD
jgi:hypothetical protein